MPYNEAEHQVELFTAEATNSGATRMIAEGCSDSEVIQAAVHDIATHVRDCWVKLPPSSQGQGGLQQVLVQCRDEGHFSQNCFKWRNALRPPTNSTSHLQDLISQVLQLTLSYAAPTHTPQQVTGTLSIPVPRDEQEPLEEGRTQ